MTDAVPFHTHTNTLYLLYWVNIVQNKTRNHQTKKKNPKTMTLYIPNNKLPLTLIHVNLSEPLSVCAVIQEEIFSAHPADR